MRNARVWRVLLGVEKTVVEGVEFVEDEEFDGDELDGEGGDGLGGFLLARVRPTRAARGRCGRCRRRCARYDNGEGRRRWRGLDLGTVQVMLEADAPRVSCPQHGVVVAHVPWARHGAGHTLAFDQTVAWLATQCSKTAVTQLMRIAWRTVGAVITRVWAEVEALGDRLDGLTWLSWARRCRIPAFVHLAQRITAIRDKIHATLDHGLSNALIESVNTKIRLLTRIAFGFRSPDALIALAMLSLGGHKPTLPDRP